MTRVPEEITTLVPSAFYRRGWLVTIIDRAPITGEHGWWVDDEADLDVVLAKVIDDSPEGMWGWPVGLREIPRFDPDDDMRSVTVVIAREPDYRSVR